MSDVVAFESAIVRRITKLLAKRGAWYVKTTGVSKVGCPDIIACYKGAFLAIECKSARGTTSRKQNYELSCIREAGGLAIVASSVQPVADWLDAIDSQESSS